MVMRQIVHLVYADSSSVVSTFFLMEESWLFYFPGANLQASLDGDVSKEKGIAPWDHSSVGRASV